jgi:hypothetical protein
MYLLCTRAWTGESASTHCLALYEIYSDLATALEALYKQDRTGNMYLLDIPTGTPATGVAMDKIDCKAYTFMPTAKKGGSIAEYNQHLDLYYFDAVLVYKRQPELIKRPTHLVPIEKEYKFYKELKARNALAGTTKRELLQMYSLFFGTPSGFITKGSLYRKLISYPEKVLDYLD